MNEQITAIRAACVTANPEIMKLKQGCLLRDLYNETEWQLVHHFAETGQVSVWHPDTGSGTGKLREFDIVGRPVRLADVLLATMKKKDGCTRSEMAEIMLSFAYLWDCFADDLERQSDETIMFVHSLLAADGARVNGH